MGGEEPVPENEIRFHYPFQAVLDCAVAYMQHGILPGAGGWLDQDEALMTDIRLCLAMLGDAMEQNGEARKDWLAQFQDIENPVAKGGANPLDLWSA